MENMEPLVADARTSMRMLGDIGLTKLYDLTNRGKVERRYIDNKAVWLVSSLKAYVAELAAEPPKPLKERTKNLKFCGDSARA